METAELIGASDTLKIKSRENQLIETGFALLDRDRSLHSAVPKRDLGVVWRETSQGSGQRSSVGRAADL